MLKLYVNYTDSYKQDNPDKAEDYLIENAIKNKSFEENEMYNDKYKKNLTSKNTYIYKIDWIMAVIVGGFFLYALFFSGMMLARRHP